MVFLGWFIKSVNVSRFSDSSINSQILVCIARFLWNNQFRSQTYDKISLIFNWD
jgi:hypothetical protein